MVRILDALRTDWGKAGSILALLVFLITVKTSYNLSIGETIQLFGISLLVCMFWLLYRVVQGIDTMQEELPKICKGTDTMCDGGNESKEKKEETSGAGAFAGMIAGGALGLPFGPPGVLIGGIVGALFGNRIESESLEEKAKKRARRKLI